MPSRPKETGMTARTLALAAVVAALAAPGLAAAADNSTVWLPHGTTMTGTTPQGTQVTVKRDDGAWKVERAAASLAGTMTVRTLDYGVVALTAGA
jgi:hypothetical protein